MTNCCLLPLSEKLREAEMASTGSEASDSQMPGGTSGRTSPASSTGQSSDVSMSTDGDMIITDSMLAEEEKLKQNAEEEQKSQEMEVGSADVRKSKILIKLNQFRGSFI